MVNYSLSSPLAPQRVRFAPQNRLLESAECSQLKQGRKRPQKQTPSGPNEYYFATIFTIFFGT